MKTFKQFLNEKFYGFNSRGGNSPNKLLAKKVNPSKPVSFKPDFKKTIDNSKNDAKLKYD